MENIAYIKWKFEIMEVLKGNDDMSIVSIDIKRIFKLHAGGSVGLPIIPFPKTA